MGGARNTEIKLEKRNSSILLGESKLVTMSCDDREVKCGSWTRTEVGSGEVKKRVAHVRYGQA